MGAVVGGASLHRGHASELFELLADLRFGRSLALEARLLVDGDEVTDGAAAGPDVLEVAVGHDPSARDDDGARAGGLDLVEVVGREQDRAIFADLLDVPDDLGLFVRIEIARRLVEDEDRRIVDERLGQTDALTVTVRERADVLAE